MTLTPSRRLYAFGIIMLVALTICSRNFGDRGGPYFMASLAVAGIAYLFAIREFFSHAEIPSPRRRRRARLGRSVASSISTHTARSG